MILSLDLKLNSKKKGSYTWLLLIVNSCWNQNIEWTKSMPALQLLCTCASRECVCSREIESVRRIKLSLHISDLSRESRDCTWPKVPWHLTRILLSFFSPFLQSPQSLCRCFSKNPNGMESWGGGRDLASIIWLYSMITDNSQSARLTSLPFNHHPELRCH